MQYFQSLFKLISGKKVKTSGIRAKWVPDIIHIFITIKWQFRQRNEYCILIGVIWTRISCIIHGGGIIAGSGDDRLQPQMRQEEADFALSPPRLSCAKKKIKKEWKEMILFIMKSKFYLLWFY